MSSVDPEFWRMTFDPKRAFVLAGAFAALFLLGQLFGTFMTPVLPIITKKNNPNTYLGGQYALLTVAILFLCVGLVEIGLRRQGIAP